MNDTENKNFIYIVKEAEQVRNGDQIYKIGMTRKGMNKRLKGYRKGTEVVFLMDTGQVDCGYLEKILLERFKNTFVHRQDFGREYFQGDVNAMIFSVTNEFMFLNLNKDNKKKMTLNNKSIRSAVDDYINGGINRERIIEKYGDIKDWNVSEVTDMSDLFKYSGEFNSPIGTWDVSNVTTMERMFEACYFNQPIGKWNVSKVNNMSCMFMFNNTFNQSIEDWDVSNVNDMSNMFRDTIFNQDLSNWNLSLTANCERIFYDSKLEYNKYPPIVRSLKVGFKTKKCIK